MTIYFPKVKAPTSSQTHTTSIMATQTPNRMDGIMASRYASLVFSQPLNALLGGDYLKYVPRFNGQVEARFNGQVEVTTEENLNAYYDYANNQNIENEYVN